MRGPTHRPSDVGQDALALLWKRVRKVVGNADGEALRGEDVRAKEFAPDLILVVDACPERPVDAIFKSAAGSHHEPRVVAVGWAAGDEIDAALREDPLHIGMKIVEEAPGVNEPAAESIFLGVFLP